MNKKESYKKSYVADKKDYKIINEIADSGRATYSQIGRLTNISKDRVRERLKRLRDELFILSYNSLIDYSFLGHKIFQIYFRFKSIKETNRVLEILKKESHVISLTQTIGHYDLGIQLLARNKKSVINFLDEKLGDIGKYLVLELGGVDIYSMKLNNSSKVNFQKENYKIDNLDIQILERLSINARENIVDIAHHTKSNVETVRYRLKSMQKKGVIKGLNGRTNKHRASLNTYIVLLDLKENSKINKILALSNIYYAVYSKGKFNYLINFSAKNNSELFQTINKIRSNLGDSLKTYEIMTLLYRRKFNPLPKGIFKKGLGRKI